MLKPTLTIGLIIVSSIVVAASIAIYENEHVREWIETTGRNISAAWDDFVNFEQRQQERRRQPMAHGGVYGRPAQGAQQRGATRQQDRDVERRSARRTLYEGAGQSQTGQEVGAEGAGVRRRRARDASQSQEALLGSMEAPSTTAEKNEVLFHQSAPSLLDQADSVLDLAPEVLETTSVWKADEQPAEPPSSADNQASATEEAHSSAFQSLISDSGITAEQPSLVGQDPKSALSSAPAETTIDNSAANNTETPATEALLFERSTSPSHALASSHLTVNIPVAMAPETQFHTPTTLGGSPGFISTPGSASPVTVHTPAGEDDEFDALSEAGTENASHFSMGSERYSAGDVDDEVRSVTSEVSAMSGWSEIGREG